MNEIDNKLELAGEIDKSADYQPTLVEPTLDQKLAISSLIKRLSEHRDIDPHSVTDRDRQLLTPTFVATGLYVPPDKSDKQVLNSRHHIIFPPNEYKLLTISPARLAGAVATKVSEKRSLQDDKQKVKQVANRASIHALESQLERLIALESSLQHRQDDLRLARGELMSARGTGYFAHYSRNRLSIILANTEMAINEALGVCAFTKGWDKEQTTRAKRTLDYKLFGDEADRYKNWKAFSLMAYHYARKRKLVVASDRQRLVWELNIHKKSQ